MTKRRRFTPEQQLSIFQEAQPEGRAAYFAGERAAYFDAE